jgi:hypothetical protein
MVPRWLTWLTFAGAATLVFAAGPAFLKSGPFAYHGLLAFYLPVVIWGEYIALTTWYMLKESNAHRTNYRFLWPHLHDRLTPAN